jgi:predicted AAA+ superfamily ATPase
MRGPRQVGKTSLVRFFCQKLKLHLIEVNLELKKSLRQSFCQMDPEQVLKDIQSELGVTITKNTLLFIDEIQFVPEAIQGLRYFYELRPDIPVIAAGSLLEFVLSDHEFSMPVGRVEMFYMGPMKFSDFLRARKQNHLFKTLISFDLSQNITVLEHTKLLSYFLEYLQIGGMPEAIREFVHTESYEKVRKIQKNILQSYRDDFSKYAKRIPLERIERVFLYATANIGKKVKYSEIDPNEQSKSLLLAIELLEKAGVIYRVFHSSGSSIPLELTKQSRLFKFLFMDIGLVSASLNLDAEEINKIYFSTPLEILLLHRGMISEQFVGQSLLYSKSNERKSIYYWLRDETANKAEVDFLIEKGLQILPIEVKAGKTGNIRSLVEFTKDKSSNEITKRSAIKMGTKPFSVRETKIEKTTLKVYEIPLYLSERLWDLKLLE